MNDHTAFWRAVKRNNAIQRLQFLEAQAYEAGDRLLAFRYARSSFKLRLRSGL